MKVTSLNVANFIVKKCHDEKINLTHMKLQKLVYIIYKEYLKKTGMKLFSERFMIWRFGPVERKIHDAYNKFEEAEIGLHYAKDSDGQVRTIKPEGVLSDVITTVWSKHSRQNGTYLSILTQQEGTAWSKGKEQNKTYLSTSDIREEFTYFNT